MPYPNLASATLGQIQADLNYLLVFFNNLTDSLGLTPHQYFDLTGLVTDLTGCETGLAFHYVDDPACGSFIIGFLAFLEPAQAG